MKHNEVYCSKAFRACIFAGRCLYINTVTHTYERVYNKILLTITVLVSVTSHMIIVGACNFLLLSFLYTLCFLQAPPLNVVLFFTWQNDPNLHS